MRIGNISKPVSMAGLLAAFLLLAPANAGAENFIIEPLDYDIPAEIEAANDAGKNLVIMFHLNGCPYCDKMVKRVYPHPDVVKLYGEKFTMIKINVKGDLEVTGPNGESTSEKDFAASLGVRATPVFVFYGNDGSDVLKLTGYQDPKMFTAAGRYVSEGAYKNGTSFIDFVRGGK